VTSSPVRHPDSYLKNFARFGGNFHLRLRGLRLIVIIPFVNDSINLITQ
jgi:hypothetical protein